MDEQTLLTEVLQQHPDAIALINLLSRTSQVWDDLIDRDNPVTPDKINETFLALLSELPRNPFYQRYFSELQPLIEAAMIDWLTANQLETLVIAPGEWPEVAPLAWCLRDNLSSIIIGCAKIIGGMAWAIEVAPKLRRHIHDEPLKTYREAL